MPSGSGPSITPGQVRERRCSCPAVAAQIARAEAGLGAPVVRVGNLDTQRDLLDVKDVVAAYLLILQNWSAIPRGSVLNIASGRAVPMRKVLDDLVATVQDPVTIEQDPARMRPQRSATGCRDASRLHSLLGWRRKHALAETLATVLADWRHQMKVQDVLAAGRGTSPAP